MNTNGDQAGGEQAQTNILKGDPNDLNLLRYSQEPVSRGRLALAVAGAILYHLLALLFLMFAPGPPSLNTNARIIADLKNAIPLYIPKDLTQHDPNRGKISHALDVRSAAPSAPVAMARRLPDAPVPAPVATPMPTPAPVRAPVNTDAPQAPPPTPATPPPPPNQEKPAVTDKPSLAFEPVKTVDPNPRVDGKVKVPDTSVDAIARQVENAARGGVRSSPSDSSVAMGDADASRLQLLSDPAGVDFKPYLIQVLSAVRTNWLTIMPEAALRRRGRVLVQFIIDRKGRMPKIVIAEESGTLALDRVAIAGVNASVPFPPLPQAYRGNEIRLQMTFSYNLPSQKSGRLGYAEGRE